MGNGLFLQITLEFEVWNVVFDIVKGGEGGMLEREAFSGGFSTDFGCKRGGDCGENCEDDSVDSGFDGVVVSEFFGVVEVECGKEVS